MGHFTPTYKFHEGDILVNSYAGMSEHDQIIRSLQQGNIINIELAKHIINSSEEQLKANIKSQIELSRNQVNAINKLIQENSNIASSLETGFSNLYNHLDSMSNKLDMYQAALIEQYRISNATLSDIYEYIKIPEFEKERIYYVQRGLDFLKQVIISPERYKDALEYFLKANSIDDTNYIVLYHIGLIYLYGHDLINLIKAEEFISKSFSYAYSAGKNIEAANIIKHLAYIYLLMGQFGKAIEAADKGIKLNPFKELKYIKAEALMIIGKSKESIKIIDELIQDDYNFVNDVLKNKTFNNSNFNEYIEKLTKISIDEINKISSKIKNKILKDSKYLNEFLNIESSTKNSSITISKLLKNLNRIKFIELMVINEINVKKHFTLLTKERIEENIENLTKEQYNELTRIVHNDAKKASRLLEDYINHNLISIAEIEYQKEKRKEKISEFFKKLILAYPILFGILFGVSSITSNFKSNGLFYISLILLGLSFLFNIFSSIELEEPYHNKIVRSNIAILSFLILILLKLLL